MQKFNSDIKIGSTHFTVIKDKKERRLILYTKVG